MNPIVLSLLLGLTAAVANGFGGFIIVQKHWDRSYLKYFVALGSGFMLAVSLRDMLLESVHQSGAENAVAWLLAGYLLVHLFEHAISPHFHFGEETHHDEFVHSHRGYRVLLGLMLHAFFDGIAITSAFLVSDWLGYVVFLAVFLHKVPEGFTVASVMLASGSSRGAAFGASAWLGVATLAGVLTMGVTQHWVNIGLPLSAGVTLYVAASDLMPEVNREPGVRMALLVFVGAGLLFALNYVFGAA